jgi:hypothetical protein
LFLILYTDNLVSLLSSSCSSPLYFSSHFQSYCNLIILQTPFLLYMLFVSPLLFSLYSYFFILTVM